MKHFRSSQKFQDNYKQAHLISGCSSKDFSLTRSGVLVRKVKAIE